MTNEVTLINAEYPEVIQNALIKKIVKELRTTANKIRSES
jgi:hypothetical protein